ncbi:MAG: LuxR family transcriptional regulator [Actinobacteria bacterium]|nr:LuxR family transcriptional regulator [Actinomycetota bacterium]
MLALGGKGRSFIKAGNVEAGLALLDEAAASAMCGDLRPHSTGLVYCLTISSCQDLGDIRRAAEWTEAANRWCDQLDVTGFPGACRIHRAEVMRLRGDWPAAEAQALEACEELLDFDRSITASGFYEIGEIRRRRGDFAGAEEAYRTTNELGGNSEPGLSLLRLAQGKVDAAVAGVAHALRETKEPLARIRRLPAQIEVAVAAGDLRTARTAADELEEIVDSYKIGHRRASAFDATTHHARGQINLAEKDWGGAVTSLRQARDTWQGVGAPYETAQARLLLVSPIGGAATVTQEPSSSKAPSRRSSVSERGSTKSERKSYWGGSRRDARSSSRTSSTRPGCSTHSGTRSGSAYSRGTTSSFGSGSPSMAAR